LTAETSAQTINVMFLFFSSYSLLIRNFINCIRSYLILPVKNLHQTMQMGFAFCLTMSRDKCNRDSNRGYFQCNRTRNR